MQWVKEIPARILCAPVLVSVLTGSKTLAELLATAGSSINVNLKKLTLIPSAGGVKWSYDATAVVASSPEWPASGAKLGVDNTRAALLTFIASSATAVQVVQEG
jgi:hypothetical protein